MANKKNENLKVVLKESEKYVDKIISNIVELLDDNGYYYSTNTQNTEVIVDTNDSIEKIRNLIDTLDIDDKIITILIDTKGVGDKVFIRLILTK